MKTKVPRGFLKTTPIFVPNYYFFNTKLLYKMASGGDKLEELEDRLEGFVESLRAVGVIAGDFQPSGQAVLNSRL